eukprot:g26206.t1
MPHSSGFGVSNASVCRREFHAQHELQRRGAAPGAEPGFAFARSLRNLDLVDRLGWTLLHHAAESHAARALQALLTARRDDFVRSPKLLRERDASGQTILARAADNESIALLLEARAEPSDRAGCCPGVLSAAAELCLDSKLLKRLDGEPQEFDALTLHLSAACGGSSALEVLLERGFAVNHRDPQGRTALHLARDGPAAEVLLAARADINGVDGDGATALHLAATRRSGEARLKGGGLRILDPSAKCLDSRYAKDWNRRDGPKYSPMAVIPDRRAIYDFDWQGVKPPGLHLKDLVIYETHVRGFTRTLCSFSFV